MPENARPAAADYSAARACACVIGALGLVAFSGWVLEVPLLRSIIPGWVEMKANTSLGFIAAGGALFLLAEPPEGGRAIYGRALAAFMVVLGFTTTLETFFHFNFHIDELLFREVANPIGTSSPGRMAPASSVDFFLTGLAMLLMDWEPRPGVRLSQALAVIAAIGPIQAIVGYTYGVQTLFGTGSALFITQMAVHAASAWLVLSLGILLARPHTGLARPLVEDFHGNRIWVRTFAVSIAVPPFVGFLVVMGMRAGVFDPGFGISVMAVASVLIVTSAVWLGARRASLLTLREEAAVHAMAEKDYEFLNLAESIPTLAWTARTDGYIDWYNRRWYDYTGTTPERMKGWGWSEVHDPEILPKVLERFRHSIENGVPFEMEFPLRGADGSFRTFLTRMEPIRNAQGKITRWFGSNTDVHEKTKNNEALRQALAHRDEFLSIASHELKTPVTSLKLQLQMAKRRLHPALDHADLTEKMGKAIDVSARQVDRLTQLIEDLLDVARIQAGKLELTFEEFELAPFLQEAFQRGTEEGQLLDFTSDVDLPAGFRVRWDRSRIEQVFSNLFSNAGKYAGGKPFSIRVRLEGDTVQMRAHDEGPGILKARQGLVFERFERATSARNISGLGLGLFIVRRILRDHGGDIRVESEPGRGTTFMFEMPKACTAAKP
jgi:PAS domain S-box-containing protein